MVQHRTNAEESNTCVSLLLTAPHDDAGKMLRSDEEVTHNVT